LDFGGDEKRRDGSSSRAVYPWKQRPCEALAAGKVPGHPAPTGLAASACCIGIVTATVTITTPNNASADTIAITANVVFWFILHCRKEAIA
jgi:hypothetical protein